MPEDESAAEPLLIVRGDATATAEALRRTAETVLDAALVPGSTLSSSAPIPAEPDLRAPEIAAALEAGLEAPVVAAALEAGLEAPVVAAALEAELGAPVAAAAAGTGAPTVLDRLREMAQATGLRRLQLRDQFITDQRRLFRLLAYRLCRGYGLQPALHQEDVEQIVAMGAITWVDELMADPAAIETIVNFEGLLHVRSRSTVRAWADRALSPASGMVSLHRRVRNLNLLRDELRAATGVEPTDRELEREHNARMTATRKDAARQGVLATAGDMAVAGPASDIHALDLAMAASEDGALHPAEGPGLVGEIIARARSIGGITADVAEAWLSGVYSAEGAQRVLTIREVAEQLGMPDASAAAQIRKVRTLAKRVLAEELGINQA